MEAALCLGILDVLSGKVDDLRGNVQSCDLSQLPVEGQRAIGPVF